MKLDRLKTLRKERGFTQTEIARRLGYKGKSGYCQLERGETKMTLDKALKLAEIFGVNVTDLFSDRSGSRPTGTEGEAHD